MFMFMKYYAPNRCEPSIEALNFGGGGDQGRYERRSEVFVKFQKKNIYFFLFFIFFFIYLFFFFFFWGGGGGSGPGVRVDVNGEVKVL